MLGRRFVTVCREGVYYLLVLAFVLGGAAARDINLLFILAGIMVGPLLFNWRIVVLSMRRLTVERHLPPQIFAGRPFRVEIRGQNQGRWVGSWMILIEDLVHAEIQEAKGHGKGMLQSMGIRSSPSSEAGSPNGPITTTAAKTKAVAVFPHIAAGETNKATYEMTLPRRGRYRFGPLAVSSRFPMGLVKASAKLKHYERVVAWPRLGRLDPRWLQLVGANRLGRQRQQYRQGPIDGDYYGLREWRPGDSRRWIHWRTTAKLGKLAVRQFEQMQDQDLALVLDLWQPEQPSEEHLMRIEIAVGFVATVIDDLSRRGTGRVTMGLAAKQPGCWSASVSPVFARQALERLALVDAATVNHLGDMLGKVVASVSPGTQTIVVSTRGNQSDAVSRAEMFAGRQRYQRVLGQITWLEVDTTRISNIFHWEEITRCYVAG